VELRGVLLVNAFFIQYKFILPSSVKHSSYEYQKIFRAIYGYTQNVTKTTGKTHKYHRMGILSDIPHLRPGKNCVIIPPPAFSKLQDFFKTGKNPTHNWQEKGNWKAVYYMDEKDIPISDAVLAIEKLLDRTYSVSNAESKMLLETEILRFAKDDTAPNPLYKKTILKEAQQIISSEWFHQVRRVSPRLTLFYQSVLKLKQPFS
jgi:hypothetical protein